MDKRQEIGRASAEGVNIPSIFAAIAILSVICAVIFYGILLTRNYQLSSTEKKLEDTETEIQSMADVDVKAKMASAAVETFSELEGQKNFWSEFLEELSRKTEVNTRFVQLSLEDEGNALSIEGVTESYESLAKFMVALRSSTRIEEAALISADLGASVSGGISFVVQATPSGMAFQKKEAVEVNEE